MERAVCTWGCNASINAMAPSSLRLRLTSAFIGFRRDKPAVASLWRDKPAHERGGFRQKAGLFIFPKNAALCRDAATVDELFCSVGAILAKNHQPRPREQFFSPNSFAYLAYFAVQSNVVPNHF